VNIEIVWEAENELHESIEYYEEIEAGLGVRLKEEVRQAIQWIRNNPLLPRIRPKGYRRVNLRAFPYYIAYFVNADTIWILAVAHGRRSPEFWLERRKQAR